MLFAVKNDHEIDCELIKESLIHGLPIPYDKSSLNTLHPTKTDFLKNTKTQLGIKNGLEVLKGYVVDEKADLFELSECRKNGK